MTGVDSRAGASADAEYQHRRANYEARIHAKWGRFGKVAVALTPERQSTRAWAIGAEGEVRVGLRLDAIAGEGIRVLHDRHIPGTRANIDHIVVTQAGVWVIDTKRYVGKAPEKRVEGGIIRPRVELLVVKGRDKTTLVDGVLKQVEHVRGEVGAVPIYGVLCFVDAEWGLFADSFIVNGVQVVWPKKLAGMISKSGEPVIDVAMVSEQIARRFVQA